MSNTPIVKCLDFEWHPKSNQEVQILEIFFSKSVTNKWCVVHGEIGCSGGYTYFKHKIQFFLTHKVDTADMNIM